MCEECRTHGVDCVEHMIAKARPDQIKRLLRDIFNPPKDLGHGTT